MNLSPTDLADLKHAVSLLESPSLTARLSNLIGSPIENAVSRLPKGALNKIHGAVEIALYKSAEAALWSMDNTQGKAASTKSHKLAAAVSGALGGMGGVTTLLIELPVSTTIMMRSVADIARSEGFDLNDLATKEACLEVFAFGGASKADDAADAGYYAIRGFMTQTISQLSKELAQNATTSQAARWLATLIQKVAERFGVVITGKVAAQLVPVIGAVAGATINTLFTNFYQDMARGHFTVMRLERQYGTATIERLYREIQQGK